MMTIKDLIELCNKAAAASVNGMETEVLLSVANGMSPAHPETSTLDDEDCTEGACLVLRDKGTWVTTKAR